MIGKTMLGLVILAIGLFTIPAFAETETILSPHKQFQNGTPLQEIQCRDSKVLMETNRGTPACVNENSVERLEGIGFEKVVFVEPIKVKETLESTTTQETIQPDKLQRKPFEEPDPLQTQQEETKPVLNPSDIDDLIPHDFELDYILKITTDNSDDFAQNLATLHNDEIMEKIVLPNGIRYDTQRGSIKIYDNYTYDFPIKYTFFGKDRIHPDKAEEVTLNLLNNLGIVLDGTELFQHEPAQTSSYTYWIAQLKDIS